jgi:hypothetical protein
MGPEAVRDFDVPERATRPILTIRVVNRGRRPVQVRTIAKAHSDKTGRSVFPEPMRLLPLVIEPDRYHDFHEGTESDYEHGSVGRMSRFYIIDGTDRTYPLRERWRQRIENLYRRARSAGA